MILILGGDVGGRSNRVRNVRITDNTIALNQGGGIDVAPAKNGNSVDDVRVASTIFWRNQGGDFCCGMTELRPDQVVNSITNHPRFVGRNGNFSANPRFKNPSTGDFRPTAASPAIDAGDSLGAPQTDFDCSKRGGPPDIGAFEWGADPLRVLTLHKNGPGRVTATPSGILCDKGPSRGYAPDTMVRLNASPGGGAHLVEWAGDPDCSNGAVTMSADRVCTAIFQKN